MKVTILCVTNPVPTHTKLSYKIIFALWPTDSEIKRYKKRMDWRTDETPIRLGIFILKNTLPYSGNKVKVV